MYCLLYDFSNILHFFTKHLAKIGLPQEIDTCSNNEYVEIFRKQSKFSINSLEMLKERMRGCLSLDIQACTHKINLESVLHNGKQ